MTELADLVEEIVEVVGHPVEGAPGWSGALRPRPERSSTTVRVNAATSGWTRLHASRDAATPASKTTAGVPSTRVLACSRRPSRDLACSRRPSRVVTHSDSPWISVIG
ncbi:MAG TPA: hypothetical protein VN408_11630 [Actinoplanes sp.]|nr:hypothetical protein [Actinoplanes sp.]